VDVTPPRPVMAATAADNGKVADLTSSTGRRTTLDIKATAAVPDESSGGAVVDVVVVTDKNKKQPFRGRAHEKHVVVEIPTFSFDSVGTKRVQTDAGVDVSDPALFQGVDDDDDRGDKTATVMGMATDYELGTYKIFVGSLRNTGFQGHVFLGVSASSVSPQILDYLESKNVTVKVVQWTNCTYPRRSNVPLLNDSPPPCLEDYPFIKPRWGRFPLMADWLRACTTCTGPVLLMDVRDSYFQMDPFGGRGSPIITGLQVFEEDPSQTTASHWITSWPISQCKSVSFNRTMLCSGTTVGTRVAMLKYLEVMYEEMKVWTNSAFCQFHINGDDQSIHNYLYYTGQLPFARAIKNRSGGIVHTVGKAGAMILKNHVDGIRMMPERRVEPAIAEETPFHGATNQTWISSSFNVTDADGFFLEEDGSRSRVVHQWDRFGPTLLHWLEKQPFAA
jgi:hypothetical protein